MRLLYVVQRYGEEIVGGSESACRMFAESLVSRGHEVTVLTSCALSYVDWANHFPAGDSIINGVRVRRLPVVQQRESETFSKLHHSMMHSLNRASMSEQFEWLDAMGPILDDYLHNLSELSRGVDAVVFMTYLYPTTVLGVLSLIGDVPIVLQPTAHDELPAYVPIYRSVFCAADSFIFFTEEERDTVRKIHSFEPRGVVAGIGMTSSTPRDSGERFRNIHGLGNDPYLLYVGRLDTFKGVSELMRYFVEFKGRHPSPLRLVLSGEKNMDLPDVEDIKYVGFLDEDEKASAIAGSVLLVQPSPFESFSIVLCEAWLQSRPVLVQGYSNVLMGQVRRSGGGLPYNGYAEFEGCLERLLRDHDLRDELGSNGRQYVLNNYNWDTVLTRFEDAVTMAQKHFQNRSSSTVI